jgi:hypothetical protein
VVRADAPHRVPQTCVPQRRDYRSELSCRLAKGQIAAALSIHQRPNGARRGRNRLGLCRCRHRPPKADHRTNRLHFRHRTRGTCKIGLLSPKTAVTWSQSRLPGRVWVHDLQCVLAGRRKLNSHHEAVGC